MDFGLPSRSIALVPRTVARVTTSMAIPQLDRSRRRGVVFLRRHCTANSAQPLDSTLRVNYCHCGFPRRRSIARRSALKEGLVQPTFALRGFHGQTPWLTAIGCRLGDMPPPVQGGSISSDSARIWRNRGRSIATLLRTPVRRREVHRGRRRLAQAIMFNSTDINNGTRDFTSARYPT